MFDEAKFKADVIGSGKTLKDVASALDISTVTLYRKMSGESDFYRAEIEKCCELLNTKNMSEIFFCSQCYVNETKSA